MKRFDMYVIIAVVVITGLLFTTFALQSKDHPEVVISLKGEEICSCSIRWEGTCV